MALDLDAQLTLDSLHGARATQRMQEGMFNSLTHGLGVAQTAIVMEKALVSDDGGNYASLAAADRVPVIKDAAGK